MPVDTVFVIFLTALQGQSKISDCHRTVYTRCPSDSETQYSKFACCRTFDCFLSWSISFL